MISRAQGLWIGLKILLMAFLCLPSEGAVASQALCGDPVMTDAGAVVGDWTKDGQSCTWKGVPYAAPPVGERRWRAPEAPTPWSGFLEANDYQPRCMQKGVMELVNFDPSGQKSEDCLYMNIWRPTTGVEAKPVMVFFHGGALFGGTANTPMYHGAHLSEFADVVVVTVNYRLAVFGYLSTEALAAEDENGSAGNYGLLDQIAALKWVEANIAGFGGDPNNVTIFGESAGAWSVCSIMASPLAQGLFDQAIMESGGCRSVTSEARGFEHGKAIAQGLGCDADDLECLRDISSRKLLRKGIRKVWKGFSWLPRVDGYALTGVPADILSAGEVDTVPMIAGNNRDEAHIIAALIPSHISQSESTRSRLMQKRFGDHLEGDVNALYAPLSKNSSRALFAQQFTDTTLLCPTLEGARSAGEFQSNTWVYRFDYTGFRFGWLVGAAHGLELPFVFGTLNRAPVWPLYGLRHKKSAQAVSEQMMTRWGLFAHTGSPNGSDLEEWAPFTENHAMHIFDVSPRDEVVAQGQIERCQYWARHVQENPWMAETLGLILPAKVPGLLEGVANPKGNGAAPLRQ